MFLVNFLSIHSAACLEPALSVRGWICVTPKIMSRCSVTFVSHEYFADKAVDLVCWIRATNLHFWMGNQGVTEYVICVFLCIISLFIVAAGSAEISFASDNYVIYRSLSSLFLSLLLICRE